MINSRVSRSVLRFGTSLGLVLFIAGCASGPSGSRPSEVATADADDQASRMVRYCRQLHEQGDHYVATGVCQKAFELDKTNSDPLHRLADIMTKAGSPDKAAEAYYMALHLNADDVEARYGLSKAYMTVGRHDLAIPHLAHALEIDDQDSRLFNAMGVSLDQQGRHADAQRHYQAGLAIAPTSSALHNNYNLSLALADAQAGGVNESTQLSAAPESVPEPTEDPLASAAVSSGAVVELKTTPPPAEPVIADPVVAEPVIAEPMVEQVAEVPPEIVTTPKPEPAPQVVEPEVSDFVEEPGPNEIEAAVIEQPASEPGQSLGQASSSLQPAQEEAQSSDLDQSAAARISDALPWVNESSQPIESAEPAVEPDRPQVAMVSPEEVHEEPAPEPMIEPLQETAAVAPPPVEISSDGPVFMVQVGSYLEQESALDGWQVITEGAPDLLSGYQPRVVRADAGQDKGIVYRLRTGPLADHEAGNALCSALSERGFGCFVVQMTPEEMAESSGANGQDIRG
ncbi:MAG: tetratricopeptide repeat protein [Pseudomonadota bacterium]